MAKIRVEEDKKLQKDYFCFVAQGVASGNYAKGDYLVLPYLLPQHPKSVYLPDLSLPKEFWARLNPKTIVDYHQPFSIRLTSHLDNLPLPTQPQITQFQKQLTSLNIPVSLITNINTLYILPTIFGTRGSFNYQKTGKKYEVFISHRLDFPITSITTTMTHVQLQIQLHQRSEVGEINWWKRQSIGDYLSGNLNLPAFSKSDLLASQKYLGRLGLAASLPDSEKIKKSLSSQESKFWQALENKSGQLLTFEEAGDSIWDDCSSFSLYSLAKIVESVRKKLAASGFNPRLLKTIRKRGYYLG